MATFRTALANAQAVMADATLSEDDQKTVDAAAQQLDAAIRGLTTESGETPNATDKPEGTDKPDATQRPEGVPQTGDVNRVMVPVLTLFVCAACLAVVAAARKRAR